jgi:multiple antibiotic resistance protein
MSRSIIGLAFSIFLLMNSIGNIPAYISILHGISHKKQIVIIIREMFIALGFILLFDFAGEALLYFLHVGQLTVQISGGIILFLISLKMVFPPPDETCHNKDLLKIKEPFIVPLAVPLVAGPAVLAAVMIYGHQVHNTFIMITSILLAWAVSLIILVSSPLISKTLGERGVIAIQRLMGLILILMSTEMFLTGIRTFMENGPAAAS